jgi:predicted SnoaL-like aldol condensation-catalyzing enzyme
VSDLHRNKQLVLDFLDLAFNRKWPEEAALRLEFKRAIGEDDLVAVHVHGRQEPGDRGLVSIDILRSEDGRLVEHRDVGQEIPESAANDNGMF